MHYCTTHGSQDTSLNSVLNYAAVQCRWRKLIKYVHREKQTILLL